MEQGHGESQACPKAEAEDDNERQVVELLESFVTVVDHRPLLKKFNRVPPRMNREDG
jgi:hypothetical protein